MTLHNQVAASRAAVDEGVACLLESLWAAGLNTQFSCQGGGLSGTQPEHASITFETVDDAVRFMRETMERTYWYNRLTLQLAEPLHNPATGGFGPVRAHVRWPAIDRYTGHSVTAELTDAWTDQQQPDDTFNRRAG